MNRQLVSTVVGFALLALCAGCSTATTVESVTPAIPTVESVTPANPSGLAAIGHSGLTGEGSVSPGEPAEQNSWATGDAPGLRSIAQRLIKLKPETEGQVANTVQGGATAGMSSARPRTRWPKCLVRSW